MFNLDRHTTIWMLVAKDVGSHGLFEVVWLAQHLGSVEFALRKQIYVVYDDSAQKGALILGSATLRED